MGRSGVEGVSAWFHCRLAAVSSVTARATPYLLLCAVSGLEEALGVKFPEDLTSAEARKMLVRPGQAFPSGHFFYSCN